MGKNLDEEGLSIVAYDLDMYLELRDKSTATVLDVSPPFNATLWRDVT